MPCFLSSVLFCVLTFCAASLPARAAPERAGEPGPFAVSTGQYQFPAVLDPEVLPTVPTELWARVFWPKQMADARPILFFLHGNHPTCAKPGERPGEHFDSNCQYTYEGVCPAGMYPAPNHEGYNYVAAHLASHGFIVVSVNANRGINCGDAVRGDEGLNLARGRLILRHMEKWAEWARRGGAPDSLGGADAFLNRVDLSRAGLMGHSRGGEGVRAAHNLYRDAGSAWPARIPGLRVRAIFEIGATDGQSHRSLDADDAAWNQLLPLCDGDVPDFDGRAPFERMWRKTSEAHPSPKSLFMVWGANHNFFNSEWQSNDAARCPGQPRIHGPGPHSPAQQRVAVIAMTSFFLGHLGKADGDARFAELFDPRFKLPAALSSITRVDRDFIPTFDRSRLFPLETFDGLTPANPRVSTSGIEYRKELNTPNRALVEWKEATFGADRFFQVDWTWPYTPRTLSELDSLGFRVGRPPANGGPKDPSEFLISLVLSDGSLSRAVPVSAYSPVLGAGNETRLLQTVQVPLRDFALGNEAIERVRGVRLSFLAGGGTIYLAGFHFTGLLPAWSQALARLGSVAAAGRSVRASQLTAQGAVAITVRSASPILPGAAVPELVLGSRRRYPLARYANPSDFRALVFHVAPADLAALPQRGKLELRVGRASFAGELKP